MARKVFLSFLGTNNYIPANYYYKQEKIDNVRFVQEAEIQIFCKDWNAEDKIFIFLTDDAYRINWKDNGHVFNNKPLETEGLEKRISFLKENGLKAQVTPVFGMKEGLIEKDIWNIFQTVFNELKPNDCVTLDITHGFRSIPMLGMVLMNYAKFLLNIELLGIYYGAFEVLGQANKVREMPIESRNAPIVNLTNFSVLQDWTSGANEFINFGNSTKIKKLLNENKKIAPKKQDKSERTFQEILDDATKMIYSVRGYSIYQGEIFDELNLATKYMKFDIQPFIHIFDKVKNELNKFNSKDKINNGFLAIEWCIRNNLTQQGLTLLEENIITAVLIELGYNKKKDLQNSYKRERISSAFYIKKNNIPESDWKGSMKDVEKGRKILESNLINKLFNVFDEIREVRNDINHAGWRSKPLEFNEFKDFLHEKYKLVKENINLEE